MVEIDTPPGTQVEDALHAAEFHGLAARKNKVSLALTLAVVCVYFGYIFLIAYRKDLLGAKISTHITWGIPVGIGVILASWILTGIYVIWANRVYDVLVAGFRKKWGK